jgi:hypothetical protein
MPGDRAVITSKHRRGRQRTLKLRAPQFLRLIRPKDFGWVFVLAGLFALLSSSGTPHLLFEYGYSGTRDNKTSCIYIGLHPQTVPSKLGSCRIIKLLKKAH